MVAIWWLNDRLRTFIFLVRSRGTFVVQGWAGLG